MSCPPPMLARKTCLGPKTFLGLLSFHNIVALPALQLAHDKTPCASRLACYNHSNWQIGTHVKLPTKVLKPLHLILEVCVLCKQRCCFGSCIACLAFLTPFSQVVSDECYCDCSNEFHEKALPHEMPQLTGIKVSLLCKRGIEVL